MPSSTLPTFTIAGGHPFLSPGTVVSWCHNPNHVRIVSGGAVWCPPGTVLSAASADVILRPGAEKEKKKAEKAKKKKAEKEVFALVKAAEQM